MSVFKGAALNLLRNLGYTIYAPGEAPRPLSHEAMAGVLQMAGWTVLPKGVQPTLPMDVMMDLVRAEGRVILAPEGPPARGNWTPKDHTRPARYVDGVHGHEVKYTCKGVVAHCSVSTFHQWRRRWDATHAGGQ